MSRYSGQQGKGAAGRTRETKRIEAEVRNEGHVEAKAEAARVNAAQDALDAQA